MEIPDQYRAIQALGLSRFVLFCVLVPLLVITWGADTHVCLLLPPEHHTMHHQHLSRRLSSRVCGHHQCRGSLARQGTWQSHPHPQQQQLQLLLGASVLEEALEQVLLGV